jgi:SAM-dependent methyltransferase
MKTDWDYTLLAEHYLKRPDYADSALDGMLAAVGAVRHDPVCDIGAGTAHLTLQLLKRGLAVTAVEPNAAMRAQGMARTSGRDVTWVEGMAERTLQPDDSFALVTFGSSFNVTDRPASLRESSRILRSDGWFTCLWNHRDINDPLQADIERVILAAVPNYAYGSRRDDQTEIIAASGLFRSVHTMSGSIVHRQTADDCVQAWQSHATLSRQSGDRFPEVVAAIEGLVRRSGRSQVQVPYITRVWLAQVDK